MTEIRSDDGSFLGVLTLSVTRDRPWLNLVALASTNWMRWDLTSPRALVVTLEWEEWSDGRRSWFCLRCPDRERASLPRVRGVVMAGATSPL